MRDSLALKKKSAKEGYVLRRISTDRFRCAAIAGGVLLALGLAAPILAAERLNDKDVKQLIDRMDSERDRFEDQLDGKLKRSIIRGPRGEVDVERYLDDLQENMDKLKGRFTSDYSGSAEVTTILRQGSDIHRYMATLPANYDGASEWTRLSSTLTELAVVYGTTFPVVEGGPLAQRMNDKELKKTAGEVAKSAEQFKHDLDASLKAQNVDTATRETAVKEADALKEAAEKLEDTIDDEKPASGEARTLLEHAAAMRTAAAGRTLSAAAKTSWGAVEDGLVKIVQAFGLPPR